MLDVALDKPSYKAGETARLRIASRQGGRALVAVLGGGLLAAHEVEIPKGGGDVPITVGSDWGPGAYATALSTGRWTRPAACPAAPSASPGSRSTSRRRR